ncbi:MAG: hypothetical protein ACR5LA_11015 [Wolbachia sp.]
MTSTEQSCDNVNLIIQLSKFNYPACNTKTIKYADLEAYGTHSVWLTDDGIKVSKVRSNRPWHKPKNLF